MNPQPVFTPPHDLLYFCGGLLFLALGLGWLFMRNPQTEDRAIEAKRIHFAAASGSGLTVVFLVGMGMQLWGGPAGSAVFDACKTVIPPFGTLVLGYYFGQSQNSARASRAETT